MISVAEGKTLIRQHARELNTVAVVLSEANGKVLAEDVYAAVDIPNYPQSSMDGYAFYFDDYLQQGKLVVNGEMAAGSADKKVLPTATAVRIFTGAAVPEGA
jgi:molybdopterin molybdotransferase